MNGVGAPQYEVIDKVGMPHVMRFIVQRMQAYDTHDLDWIKLLPLKKNTLLHGECVSPYFGKNNIREHGYRIRASVNVEMPPPFVFEHWGRVSDRGHARGWKSGDQTYHFRDLEECAVHTLSHECFHFLSESGQIPEKNMEANANWWADGWLASFRLTQQPQDESHERAASASDHNANSC